MRTDTSHTRCGTSRTPSPTTQKIFTKFRTLFTLTLPSPDGRGKIISIGRCLYKAHRRGRRPRRPVPNKVRYQFYSLTYPLPKGEGKLDRWDGVLAKHAEVRGADVPISVIYCNAGNCVNPNISFLFYRRIYFENEVDFYKLDTYYVKRLIILKNEDRHLAYSVRDVGDAVPYYTKIFYGI